jgi:Kinesin motor domain
MNDSRLDDDETPGVVPPVTPVAVGVRFRPLQPWEKSRRSRIVWAVEPAADAANTGSTLRQLEESDENEESFATSTWSSVEMVSDEDRTDAPPPSLAASLPDRFCAGYNCNLIAYGPAGTGKTTALFGNNTTTAKEALFGNNTTTAKESSFGLLGEMARAIFQILHSRMTTRSPGCPDHDDEKEEQQQYEEYTVRLSCIDLSLNRLRDLFSRTTVVYWGADHRFHGATCISCTSPDDVLQSVQYATTCRQVAQQHSSSLVVQLVLERTNWVTGQASTSHFHIIDLMPSEPTTMLESDDVMPLDQVEQEPASVQAVQTLRQFQAHIREAAACTQEYTAITSSREDGSTMTPLMVPPVPLITGGAGGPVLFQLLRSTMGGGANGYTVLLLCATPSHLAVAATRRTLTVGRYCGQLSNRPRITVVPCWQPHGPRLARLEQRQQRLQDLVHYLSHESQRLLEICSQQTLSGTDSRANKALMPLLEAIRACREGSEHENENNGMARQLGFTVESKQEHETKMEMMRIRNSRRKMEQMRDQTLAEMAQLRSDVAILREENQALRTTCAQQEADYAVAQREAATMKQRVVELEHRLRVSSFREQESIVFCRQFRRFYLRLLKQTAMAGNGTIRDIASKIPGATDLSRLVDIDHLMFDSGLLEEHEVGNDAGSKSYRPSAASLSRSSDAANAVATKAEAENSSTALQDDPTSDSSQREILTEPSETGKSIITRELTGEQVEARQKLYQTPAGTCIELREAYLEAEITHFTEKYHKVKKTLEEGKLGLKHGALLLESLCVLIYQRFNVVIRSSKQNEQMLRP